MSSYGTPLVMALVFVALLNWYAVARGEVSTERVTKPSFHLLLIALVWLLRSDLPAAGPGRDLLVPLTAALVLYLLSDLALLATSVPRYVLGQFVAVVADVTLTLAIWRGVGAAVADPGKASSCNVSGLTLRTAGRRHRGPGRAGARSAGLGRSRPGARRARDHPPLRQYARRDLPARGLPAGPRSRRGVAR